MSHPADREPSSTLTGVFSATPSKDGTKFLLHLDTSEGPLNLEVPVMACPALLTGIFQSLIACHEAAPAKSLSQPGLDATKAVYMPTDEMGSLDTPAGGKKLAFRVGGVDLTVWLETKRSVQALLKILK